MLKFLKKRKERKAKEHADEWREIKKTAFVNRLKNGKPRHRPLMKVTGNYGKM